MSGWNYVGLALLIIIGIILYLFLQNTQLKVTHYQIRLPYSSKSLKGKKILHLSDLHLPRLHVSVERLLEQVANEKPDMIALTGDLIDVRYLDFPKLELAEIGKSLVKIAPTYAVTGNHDLTSGHLQEWEDILTSAGVRVLIDEAVWAPFETENLVIMGLSEKEDFDAAPKPILREVTLTGRMEEVPRILLAHHPELFEEYLMDLTRVPDLILSGHAHGGQIRLPWIGGLFAPEQGFFPKYTSGIYYDPDISNKRMLVNRGIGNSSFPFRVNNHPEIVVITLN